MPAPINFMYLKIALEVFALFIFNLSFWPFKKFWKRFALAVLKRMFKSGPKSFDEQRIRLIYFSTKLQYNICRLLDV